MDLSNIQKIARGPNLMRYVLIWLENNEQITAFQQRAERVGYVLAVRVACTGEFSGLTFLEIDPVLRSTGEIGIVLLPEYRACEYGKEILLKYLEFGFTTLSVHRVYGKCDELNHASACVMEQCGLIYEVTIREHVWLSDHWRSTRYHGMLAG